MSRDDLVPGRSRARNNKMLVRVLSVIAFLVGFVIITHAVFGGASTVSGTATTATSQPSSRSTILAIREEEPPQRHNSNAWRGPGLFYKRDSRAHEGGEEETQNHLPSNLWSQHAKKANLKSKFPAFCRVCKSRVEMCSSTGTYFPEKPGFDFSNSFLPLPVRREDNMKAIEGAESVTSSLPEHLHVIFCAIGKRFDGPGGQSYVIEAIRQFRLFHPLSTTTVHLIVDREIGTTNERIQNEIVTQSITLNVRIHFQDELLSDEWRRYFKVFYIQGYMHPGGSRRTGNQHFNQYVSERFFAVEALMRKLNLRHVIHLENDIMVYDFLLPVAQAAARCGYRMASTTISTKGVIPSVLYVRSADDLAHFNHYLNDFLSCGKEMGELVQHGYANDMTYMMNYYQLFGAEYLGLLPSWEHREGELCIERDFQRQAAALQQDTSSKEGASLSATYGGYFPLPPTAQGVAATVFSTVPSSLLAFTQMKKKSSDESPTSLSGGRPFSKAIFDVASFGQWYSFAALHNSSVPPLHVRNSMRGGRFIDATPPEAMRWEPYSAEQPHLRVPAWKSLRLLSLHVHAKNLRQFSSAKVL